MTNSLVICEISLCLIVSVFSLSFRLFFSNPLWHVYMSIVGRVEYIIRWLCRKGSAFKFLVATLFFFFFFFNARLACQIRFIWVQ
jgi:hypothetical protein